VTISVTNGYTTVNDLAAYLTIAPANFNDDLAYAINAASRFVDTYCARRFYADGSDSSRVFWTKDPRVQIIDDCYSVTSVKLSTNDNNTFDKTFTAGTDYTAEPLNGIADGVTGLPTYRLRWLTPTLPLNTQTPCIQVTGKWGWAAVPMEVRQATIIIAAETFKLKEAPFGVAGFSEMGVVRIGKMSPQAAAMLRPYRTGDSLIGIG